MQAETISSGLLGFPSRYRDVPSLSYSRSSRIKARAFLSLSLCPGVLRGCRFWLSFFLCFSTFLPFLNVHQKPQRCLRDISVRCFHCMYATFILSVVCRKQTHRPAYAKKTLRCRNSLPTCAVICLQNKGFLIIMRKRSLERIYGTFCRFT